MKYFLTIVILSILILPVFGQVIYHSEFEKKAFERNDAIQIMIASDPKIGETKYAQISSEINELLEKLHSKEGKFQSKQDFLEWAFYYVHRKRLGWYEKYVSLSDLLEHKKYDCLTGTILYSIILNEFKIPYTIHEFDYHIFLVINLPDQNILIETTDPLNGFIKNENEIEERVSKYVTLSSNDESETQIGVGQQQRDFYGNKSHMTSIDLRKLAGLQYFNLSIRAYNNREAEKALQFIDKAETLYPSIRMTNTKKSILSSL